MMLEEKRKKLTDNGYADVILFEMQSYDKSLVGVTADRRAVYDYDMMVEEYMADNGCDAEDATECYTPKSITVLTLLSPLYAEDGVALADLKINKDN